MFDMIGRDTFIVDIVFKLCLSDMETCATEIPLLTKQEILKPFCKDILGFKIPGKKYSVAMNTKHITNH